MNKNSITNVKDLFIILITFAIVLSVINVITEKVIFESNAKKEAMNNALKRINNKEKVLNEFLFKSANTIKALRQTELFNLYLDDFSRKKEIEDIFLSFSKSQTNFMQFRYIDKNGYEKIRIDRDKKNKPFIVKKEKLQNKKNRYYFSDSMSKPLEKIWFSALDLNMEKGEVERPYKPTLRAMYPIKHKGKFNGVLIINYLMIDFLDHFTDTPLYDTIIFNNKGFPLKHYDKTKSWGAYKDIRSTILDQFPDEYSNIMENKLYKSDNFVSKKLDTPILGGINMILHLKESYMQKQKARTNFQYILITTISLVSAFLLTIIIIKFFSRSLLNVNVISKLNQDLETASRIAKIGFWEYSSQSKNLKWNSGVYTIYDMKKSTEEVAFEEILEYIHTNDRTKFQKDFKQAIKENKEFHNIHRIITPNNDIKYVEEKAIHIYDQFGEHVKSLGSIMDITDLKNQEKQLHRAEKMASMGEMIGNIAHQWRQPLSVISTISTSYQMKKELNIEINMDNLFRDMDKVNDNAQYLSRTIDDFRNFIGGNSELKNFDLKKDTKQFLQLIETSIKNHHIKVILEEIEENTIIKGYPNELIQCFINIFNNAKDALKDNEEEERYLFITQKVQKDKVIIIFKDNAGGIPTKILSKIFEPYFTTKHQSQGTGIGLHMTYNLIVQAMDGSIEATNVQFDFDGKKYKGAEFTITLPLNKE